MNLINKFKLDFITSDSPKKSRESILSKRTSEFINESTRTSGISSRTLFLLKEL
jgi:hypothetical protein